MSEKETGMGGMACPGVGDLALECHVPLLNGEKGSVTEYLCHSLAHTPIQSLTGDTTCENRAPTAQRAADCLTIHAKRKGGAFMDPCPPISGQLSLQNPPQFNYSAGPGGEPSLSPILNKCWPRMPRQGLTFQAQVALFQPGPRCPPTKSEHPEAPCA